MEWNQVSVGAVVTFLGLMAFMAANDFISSIPGNLLFFSGVVVMTFGSSNPAAKMFLSMATLSLVYIVGAIVYMVWKNEERRRNQLGEKEWDI